MYEKKLNYYNNEIYNILDFIEKMIPNQHWISVAREGVEHSESQISIECICENIFEYDIKLTQDIYDRLIETCHFFDISEEYWNKLCVLVQLRQEKSAEKEREDDVKSNH